MDHIRHAAFETSRHLPNHQRLLKSLFHFFQPKPEVHGCFLQGAAASGALHTFSDLDLGILCESKEARDRLWAQKDEWKISPLIRFFKTDLTSSFQTTYISQPHLHIDLNFYTAADLPAASQGPFLVAWDQAGKLEQWSQEMILLAQKKINWAQVVHEDEQFWVWTHFSASHAARGDYHDVIGHLEDLREIVHVWQGRLDQMARANIKKTGNRFQPEFLDRMKRTFCPPHSEGIKLAFKNLIKIQLQQRALIDRTISPRWTVSLPTISKIQTYSQTFN